MDSIQQQIFEWLLVFLALVITGCIPVLARVTVNWVEAKISVEKMRKITEALSNEQSLAVDAVRFAEQLSIKLGFQKKGQEKYMKAFDWLEERLLEYGIEANASKIEGLVESALRLLQDEFGEQWAQKIKLE